ncbi:MAG: O-antigen ligase family protein [Bryobacteraceae bacterium]
MSALVSPQRTPNAELRDQLLMWLAIAAVGLINISISASQATCALGIVLLLIFRRKLEFPRIWIPIVGFFLWTVLSAALCPDPVGGLPLIRKFLDFLFIPLVYGAFSRRFGRIYLLVIAWTATATASGLLGMVQYASKYEHAKLAGVNFYLSYLPRRITGFQGHWLMFGALQLGGLSLVLAHYFFAARRMPGWAYGSVTVFLTAILLSWDRSIWLAAVPVCVYLIWFWRPRIIFIVPLAAVLIFAASPASTKARVESIVSPHGDIDSNRFRIVVYKTGIQIVKAHPWFGVGPGQIRRQFDSYVPTDIERPLPPGFYGHLHNFYIQYAAESGIPSLIFVLWFIGWAMWDCLKGISRAGRARSDLLFMLHGAMAVTIGILVGGLFEHNLGDSEVLMMFVSVLALEYAALRNLWLQADKHRTELRASRIT